VKSEFELMTSILISCFFDLAPSIRSFAPTNSRGAQTLGKEFPASTPQLIQGANP
jgi:hypothetical protein